MNLIPIIAVKLELKLGEEFTLKGYEEERFMFDPSFRFLRYWNDRWEIAPCEVLYNIVHGEYEVIKLPFQPKYGEKYWTYCGIVCTIVECEWKEDFYDYRNRKLGIIFRTKEEAENALPAKFFEITGKEWQE